MPQIGKGGKFVFGWSLIRDDYSIRVPDTARDEYGITSEGKVFLISGSRTTGGFVVSRRGLIGKSEIKALFEEHLQLYDYNLPEGEWIKIKGRSYCWLRISDDGVLNPGKQTLEYLGLNTGDRLLSIRGSWVGFVLGVRGPLVKMANEYPGEIPVY